jgi:hypothetical protein
MVEVPSEHSVSIKAKREKVCGDDEKQETRCD